MRNIYLIRHGETDLNKRRAFYGSLDVPINETGIEQANTLKEKFSRQSIETLYVSGMKRANMTADIIFPNEVKKIDIRLNEKGFGKWEGLIADEIEAAFPSEWEKWLNEPFDYTPPGAESFAEFKERVLTGFEDILSKSTGDLAVVCHLGVIRVIVEAYQNTNDFWSIKLDQDSWIELTIEEKD
ncbi:MAG: histidine phosphatase family protein [Vagococcus sp.]|uniref:histidine phosphatase family protein n=1 Tax=Vagococcus sp. TaxID=1933889 RepID=UPI002FCB7EBE